LTLRVAIKVAYFNIKNLARGFQIQPDVETIFSFLQRAIIKTGFLESQEVKIDYAGRTDHGVNAICQVIAFNIHEKWNILPDRFLHRINANLPQNIRCWAFALVSIDFHPRFDAISRCYHYHIYSQSHRDPLKDRYAWCVWPAFSVDKIESASKLLLGTHNFSAFGSPPIKGGHANRTVISSEWLQIGLNEWVYKIRANAFLYHMVRRLVFLLVKIGQGYWAEEKFIQGINNQLPQMSGLAKPNGLNLFEVQYQELEKNNFEKDN